MNTKPLLALLLIGFLGAVSPLQAQTALTWDGGSTVDDFWSSNANWNPNAAVAGQYAYFSDTGKGAISAVGNIVSQDVTLESLSYVNKMTNTATTSPYLSDYTNNWQVTNINSGVTLTLNAAGTAPTNILTVGRNESGPFITNARIQGEGSLVINESSSNIWINNPTNSSSVIGYAELDMSGLKTFTANINKFEVGTKSESLSTSKSVGVVRLADTNTITATSIIVGSTEGVSNGAGTRMASSFLLGRRNTINVNDIYIGAASSAVQNRNSGLMQFQAASGSDVPEVIIRAADGVGRTNLTIGKTGATSGDTIYGTVDFTGGTVDALLNELVIAEGFTAAVTGTLSMSAGTIDATTVRVGYTGTGGSSGAISGNLNVSGGAFTAASLILASSRGTNNQPITSTVNVSGSGFLTVTGNLTMGDRLSSNAGALSANLNIVGGTVKVEGNLAEGTNPGSINSTVTLNGGTLDMDGGNMSSLNTFNVQSGTLKNLAQFNSGANITKTTSGTLIIDGTNAYTGDTLVNEGTVRVNGSTTASTNDFTVANAATLGGASGSIAGTVTIQAGGTLDPGASASSTGLLTTGSLALQSSSAVKMQINGATAGAGYDQVTVNGTVNLGSAADLQLTLGYGTLTVGQTFSILLNDGTDAITGAFATINGAAFGADNTFDLAYNSATYSFKLYYTGNGTSTTGGNDAVLEVTAVPEPSTIALAASAAAGVIVMAFRRRR